MTSIRLLSGNDVRRALPMAQAIESMKGAFAQLSAGEADVPLRAAIDVEDVNGITLFMPGYLAGGLDGRGDLAGHMAIKIVSVFNDNPALGLPLIHALVVVIDTETGAPAAVMDGSYLTALRTGAASGAATDLLAWEDARTATVFGAGTQGRTQLEAVCAVRPIQLAWVYDISSESAQAYAAEMSERLDIPVNIAASAAEAASQADVICTATTSSMPVFSDADVQPGTHINAVGAYTPEMQEIPPHTILRAKVVIDDLDASMAEAGDLIIPLEQGLMDQAHIHAELGEIIAGEKLGRETREEITLFKSVGVAVQDVAAAGAVLDAAQRLGLGTEVAL